MKRRAILPVVFLCIAAMIIAAAAVGGSADDPLISLSYLNGTYTSAVNAAIDQKLAAAGSVTSCADNWTETRLKSGDFLSGTPGTNLLILAGSVQVTFSSGAVIDVSSGSVISSGTVLTAQHRYLVAEDTAAAFTVTSKTAVVDYQGPYGFTYSDSIDYNAMAQALKALHLFRGSLTGYGSGFDLEASPTRLQALIMFIRLLGEEDTALAWTGTTPFSDVASGTDAARYVGYAYSKGYTNGYTPTTFAPSRKVNAYQYTEFVLRALGYSSSSNTDLSDTLSRAVNCGVLTAGEQAMLAQDPFLRAELVYVSYYTLDATLANGNQTLKQSLCAQGVFSTAEAASAASLISSGRIS